MYNQQPVLKTVGFPCSTCGTPYIQGPKGAYCKACYIQFKNGASQPVSAPKSSYQPVPSGQLRPSQNQSKTQSQPNWDEISKGKVRHGVAVEAFKMGMQLNSQTKQVIDSWVNYIMTGNLPAIDQQIGSMQVEQIF